MATEPSQPPTYTDLRKLVLGLTQDLPNNRSWRFIDAGYQFPDPNDPWLEPFAETYHINGLTNDMEANFIGIKIGDVTGNAKGSAADTDEAESRSASLGIEMDDVYVNAGQTLEIPVRAVVCGTSLLLLANSWSAFMMAPSGVDGQGRYLGNPWHLLRSALWNPLNLHRFLADIMSGGALVLAYACYRFFSGKSREERAYYEWVGYVCLFVTVCALLPMPFAGYWLMRSVYAYSQSMGVTMMGGLLTWLFVVQALLIGALFLGVNYYLWQSMGRIQGGERYQHYYQYLLLALTGCLFIWLTPHTLLMTGTEVKAMGGAQHPVIGNYRVMSSKNGAVNVMICITALSYIYYRRANRTMSISWARTGNVVLGALFGLGAAHIIGLSIYGFYLPASLRVGLSGPQAVTTLLVVTLGLLLNRRMLRGATVHGPVQWGQISVRGMVGLFGLAAAFTWVALRD